MWERFITMCAFKQNVVCGSHWAFAHDTDRNIMCVSAFELVAPRRQGLTVNVLVARLGLAARLVCRPLPLRREDVRSSLSVFVGSMWDALHGRYATS